MSKAASNETVTGKILAARRALRRTDWDVSDLDHFVQVLCRLDAGRHGFGALDLLAVEGAWIGALDGRPARRRRAASRARRPPWLAGPFVERRDGAPAQRTFGQG